ncbi:TPA: phenolic acid decarboxylase [Citrobacter amalonaticus]|uniref:phenolic acid decarboxylase n=1 Tax=Citrobacter TaxID=544 RepID=UPI0009E2BDA5|nr:MULTISPECIES: phenolic acid decarboxylase [Citrobacter]AUZ63811.1 hypothetical protein C2U53_08165 [Citrobacter sp. CFNIH10]EKY5003172.1 phenolic acid decarboxylase [Citrobacter amalonaticus]ELN9501554.1 phenolic acid decarboxylase [Citrobacter amalonaticus]ELW9349203.1 phenolic acid decarboxylase [Citrobacter amalonaticus]MBJ9863864.1 phenolic acid decarboxylase [Citrobacter amalonaticus]
MINIRRCAEPAYLTAVINELARINFMRGCGANNDSVIDCAASEILAYFHENLG